MSDILAITRWNGDAMRHSTSELWAMVTVAADKGINVERCLVGTLLDIETLCHRRSRVSFGQQMEIQRRLSLLGLGPEWPVEVAARLHLTSYGIGGFALLSSDSLAAGLQLAQRFAPLLGLKHDVEALPAEGGLVRLQMRPGYRVEADLRASVEVMEVLKLTNLLRELLGAGFRPAEIRLASWVEDSWATAITETTRCRVRISGAFSEIFLDEHLLHARLPQADATTCRSCVEVCEQQLREASRFDKTVGRVRALLENCVDKLPSMVDVAALLCMSSRSLRRRLDAEGTSFHEIIDGLRKDMAEQLLCTTRLSTEVIAEQLGYCDAANFRTAFKRWNGESPRQYRERHQADGSEALATPTPQALMTASIARPAPRAQ